MLVSAAGISTTAVHAAPLLTLGRAASAAIGHAVPRQRAVARRPDRATSRSALVARHPSLLKPDLAYEGFIARRRQARLQRRLPRHARLRLPPSAAGDRLPDADRLGRAGRDHPGHSDAHDFERLIPDSRKLVMRDTGHVSMAERPRAFNDALLEFLAERGAAEHAEAGVDQAA